jgi:hypothetical protein
MGRKSFRLQRGAGMHASGVMHAMVAATATVRQEGCLAARALQPVRCNVAALCAHAIADTVKPSHGLQLTLAVVSAQVESPLIELLQMLRAGLRLVLLTSE